MPDSLRAFQNMCCCLKGSYRKYYPPQKSSSSDFVPDYGGTLHFQLNLSLFRSNKKDFWFFLANFMSPEVFGILLKTVNTFNELFTAFLNDT